MSLYQPYHALAFFLVLSSAPYTAAFVAGVPDSSDRSAVGSTSQHIPHKPLTAAAEQRPATFAQTQLAAVGRIDPEHVNMERPHWLPKLPGSCESDYECEGMESCCDFLFFKTCCSDGHAQEQYVPVPIPVRPGDGYYGGYRR